MTLDAKIYKIFIASPAGLDSERALIKKIINRFNEENALDNEIVFWPYSWTEMPPTYGRPQNVINEKIKDCDYFILLLHDRWGSSPDKQEITTFRSGIEEEYFLAKSLVNDQKIKDICILFKAIDSARLGDPGEQLRGVLHFRMTLDNEKEFLYQQFDCEDDLGKYIRTKLGDWARKIRCAENNLSNLCSLPLASSNQPYENVSISIENSDNNELRKTIESLVAEGMETEAEIILAKKSSNNTLSAVLEYGRFLSHVGRLTKSLDQFDRLLELAMRANNHEIMALTYIYRGALNRTLGRLGDSEAEFKRALSIFDKTGIISNFNSNKGKSISFYSLGIVFRIRGNLSESEKCFNRSLEICNEIFDEERVAQIYDQLGVIYRIRGEMNVAKGFIQKSLGINEGLGKEKRIADNKAHLGTIFRLQGNLSDAEVFYNDALKYNIRHIRKRLISENLGGLGRIAMAREKYLDADAYFVQALEYDLSIGCNEGIAKRYAALAELSLCRGELEKVEIYCRKSKEINIGLGAIEGLAFNCLLLGRLSFLSNNRYEAKKLFISALENYKTLGSKYGEADTLAEIGNCIMLDGNVDEALKKYSESLELFSEIGETKKILELRKLINQVL